MGLFGLAATGAFSAIKKVSKSSVGKTIGDGLKNAAADAISRADFSRAFNGDRGAHLNELPYEVRTMIRKQYVSAYQTQRNCNLNIPPPCTLDQANSDDLLVERDGDEVLNNEYPIVGDMIDFVEKVNVTLRKKHLHNWSRINQIAIDMGYPSLTEYSSSVDHKVGDKFEQEIEDDEKNPELSRLVKESFNLIDESHPLEDGYMERVLKPRTTDGQSIGGQARRRKARRAIYDYLQEPCLEARPQSVYLYSGYDDIVSTPSVPIVRGSTNSVESISDFQLSGPVSRSVSDWARVDDGSMNKDRSDLERSVRTSIAGNEPKSSISNGRVMTGDNVTSTDKSVRYDKASSQSRSKFPFPECFSNKVFAKFSLPRLDEMDWSITFDFGADTPSCSWMCLVSRYSGEDGTTIVRARSVDSSSTFSLEFSPPTDMIESGSFEMALYVSPDHDPIHHLSVDDKTQLARLYFSRFRSRNRSRSRSSDRTTTSERREDEMDEMDEGEKRDLSDSQPDNEQKDSYTTKHRMNRFYDLCAELDVDANHPDLPDALSTVRFKAGAAFDSGLRVFTTTIVRLIRMRGPRVSYHDLSRWCEMRNRTWGDIAGKVVHNPSGSLDSTTASYLFHREQGSRITKLITQIRPFIEEETLDELVRSFDVVSSWLFIDYSHPDGLSVFEAEQQCKSILSKVLTSWSYNDLKLS